MSFKFNNIVIVPSVLVLGLGNDYRTLETYCNYPSFDVASTPSEALMFKSEDNPEINIARIWDARLSLPPDFFKIDDMTRAAYRILKQFDSANLIVYNKRLSLDANVRQLRAYFIDEKRHSSAEQELISRLLFDWSAGDFIHYSLVERISPYPHGLLLALLMARDREAAIIRLAQERSKMTPEQISAVEKFISDFTEYIHFL